MLTSPFFAQLFGGADGCSLPLDKAGLLREVAAIAWPGTKFQVHEACGDQILRVSTQEYLYSEQLFVDRRFLELCPVEPGERPTELPDAQTILTRLTSCIGLPYIWGGNWPEGIPQMLCYYPPKGALQPHMQRIWTMQGIDCTGLLFWATLGSTPRNSSDLVHYGRGIPVQGLDVDAIASQLQPLDLIAWNGHIVIAYDTKQTIESRYQKGVVLSDLKTRIEEIFRERVAANEPDPKSFVVRRWISL